MSLVDQLRGGPGPGREAPRGPAVALRRALLFAVLLLLLVAAHALLETARDSLFLVREPLTRLPIMFLAVTAAVLALTPVQRTLWAAAPRAALPLTLAGAAGVTLLFWGLSGQRGVVLAFYVWTALFSSLVFVQFWLTADDAFGLDDAKKAFGLIAAGGLVGAVAGSAGARLLVQVSSPVLLLPASTVVTLGAAVFAVGVVRGGGPGRATEPGAVLNRAVPEAVRADPYLRLLAILTLLAAASATLLDYLFKAAVVTGTAPERIPRVIANVQLGQSMLALLVELVLVRLLLGRAGVTRSLALLPLLLLASTAGYAVVGSLALLFVLKMLDGGIRPSIHRVGTELLYLPVAAPERRLIKPSIDILGQRGGQAVASVGLLVTGSVAAPARLTVVTAFLAVVALGWILATRALRNRYLVRFQSQLGAGRLDSLAPGQLDLRSAEVLVAALGSPRTVEVLTALDLLGRAGRPGLIPALVLQHRDTSVVLAALRVLGPLGRPDVEATLPALLRHSSPAVRSAAARCWIPGSRPAEELLPLLEDTDPGVRAAALVALSADPGGGRPHRARLVFLARRGNLEERRALARAIADAHRPDLLRLALWMFRSDDREIRQALLESVEAFPSLPPRFISRAVAMLVDPPLRPGARRALIAMGRPARDLLEQLLLLEQTPFTLARELPAALAGVPPEEAAPALLRRLTQPRGGLSRFRALRALNHLRREHPRLALDPESLASALRIELGAARRNRALREAGESLDLIGGGDPAGRLLLDLLQDKETRALERVFRTLDLLLPGRQLERAFHATRSSSVGPREAAREVLLELLPARWRDPVLELLAPQPLSRDGLSPAARLSTEAFVEAVLRQKSEAVRLLAHRLARQRGWSAAS